MIRLLQVLFLGCALVLSMVEAQYGALESDLHCSSLAECSNSCASCHTLLPPSVVGGILLPPEPAEHTFAEVRTPQLLLISDIFRPPASSLC